MWHFLLIIDDRLIGYIEMIIVFQAHGLERSINADA